VRGDDARLAVRYKRFDGKPVSVAWHRVLTRARNKGVRFRLNSGHRTFAEQQALFDQNMVAPGVPKPGRPLTAVPSHAAPHIRTGRADHALDVGPDPASAQNLARWLNARGRLLGARFTVPGEWWHIEVRLSALGRLAQRILERFG
jgi:hypothetical protein